MNLIQTLEQEEIARMGKKIPVFAPGDTVVVSVNVVEGTRSLDHVDTDHHGVARGENRDFLAHTGDFFLFQGLDEIHVVLTMIMDALHKRPMVLKTRGGHPEDRKPAIVTGWLSLGLMGQELLICAGQKPRLTGFF